MGRWLLFLYVSFCLFNYGECMGSEITNQELGKCTAWKERETKCKGLNKNQCHKKELKSVCFWYEAYFKYNNEEVMQVKKDAKMVDKKLRKLPVNFDLFKWEKEKLYKLKTEVIANPGDITKLEKSKSDYNFIKIKSNDDKLYRIKLNDISGYKKATELFGKKYPTKIKHLQLAMKEPKPFKIKKPTKEKQPKLNVIPETMIKHKPLMNQNPRQQIRVQRRRRRLLTRHWITGFESVGNNMQAYEYNVGMLGIEKPCPPNLSGVCFKKHCTATLLPTKGHIITAGHCVCAGNGAEEECLWTDLNLLKWFPGLNTNSPISLFNVPILPNNANIGPDRGIHIIAASVPERWFGFDPEFLPGVGGAKVKTDDSFDFAILTLDPNDINQFNWHGATGLGISAFNVNRNIKLAFYGYPADANEFSKDYRMKKDPHVRNYENGRNKAQFPWIGPIDQGSGNIYIYNKRTYPGQSGGPYLDNRGGRSTHLIHATHEGGQEIVRGDDENFIAKAVPYTNEKVVAICGFLGNILSMRRGCYPLRNIHAANLVQHGHHHQQPNAKQPDDDDDDFGIDFNIDDEYQAAIIYNDDLVDFDNENEDVLVYYIDNNKYAEEGNVLYLTLIFATLDIFLLLLVGLIFICVVIGFYLAFLYYKNHAIK